MIGTGSRGLWLCSCLFAGCATQSPVPDGAAAGGKADQTDPDLSYPRLFFRYSRDHDSQYCPQFLTRPGVVSEALSHTEELQQEWDSEGAPLLAAVVEQIGLPFERREETVDFTLCMDKPTMARPLLVNVGWTLPSMMAPDEPLPDITLINAVFHELLHHHVSDLLGGTQATEFQYSSPLTDRFAADWLVAGHIHLMAIQTAVYQRLDRGDLAEVNHRFAQANPPPYLQAWRIVNDPTYAEYVGVDALLDELTSPGAR